ncbi:DcrB-related protein, partial [Erwinia amylovora]|uniref:DcrB-related protein n=1 Tax=Erwinia amylovora TaxID=552 RepID=UPI0037DD3E1E
EAQQPGESVSASYLRDGQRIWQHQAVFALAGGRVLVFTLAQTRALSAPSPDSWQTRSRRAAAPRRVAPPRALSAPSLSGWRTGSQAGG